MSGEMGELKVTTQLLRTKMTEVLNRISEVQGKLEAMGTLVERTNGCWIGEAGDQHRKSYRDLRPEADRIVKLWENHAIHLGQIAGVYEESEAQASASAEALPADVIS